MENDKKLSRILVPVDGSEGSNRAIAMASAIAEGTGATLYLLHVSYFDRTTDDVTESWLPSSITAPAGREEEEILTRARQLIPDTVTVECHHRTGTPAEEILSFTEEHHVDLIVIGGRKLGLVEGFFAGSVSREILKSAPVSVLLAR
jgi:nucleotide-binding universal stress UspA family protein